MIRRYVEQGKSHLLESLVLCILDSLRTSHQIATYLAHMIILTFHGLTTNATSSPRPSMYPDDTSNHRY